jgi:hypothetical protein
MAMSSDFIVGFPGETDEDHAKTMRLIDDIGNYEAPVVLDNGDILIKRKPAAPTPLKEGEVEL